MFTNIEELIGSLKLKLPEYLEENGVNTNKPFCCLSPSHDDKNPSMSLMKDGVTVKCFSCGVSGDIFSASSWLEEKPLDGSDFILENVFYLAEKYKLPYSISTKDNNKNTFKYLYFKAYKIVYDIIFQFASSTPNESFLKELKKRKWRQKETLESGIGCIPDYKSIRKALLESGFTEDFIKIIGLEREDLFSEDSFIFTIFDEFNRPIAFYSRDTEFENKKIKYEQLKGSNELNLKAPMKYNSTANCIGIYEKSLNPYGINDCKNFHKVIAVEGHGCKHALKMIDVNNVIALGGLSLNDAMLEKLISLGVTHLVLLLDNDNRAEEKVKNIIAKYFGKLPIEISIMDLSTVVNDVKDPDELIRKYGKEIWNQLKEFNCLEWIIRKENNVGTKDPYTILQNVTPLIALERSPISRLKIISSVSQLTNIPREAIVQEVDYLISMNKDRRGEVTMRILDEAKDIIIGNPDSIDGAISFLEAKLSNLNKNNGANDEMLFSNNECIRSLIGLQERQEDSKVIPIINTGIADIDSKLQLPTNEVFCLIMGPPNSGKTAFINTTTLGILENTEDAMVIIHTIDDSREVYINRLVSAQSKLKINWVKRPNFYLDKEKFAIRQECFKKIYEYMRDDRLVIKDIEHGNSAEYHGKLINFYRNKYPERKIISFCDNFHRLSYEADDGLESRQKYRAMSGLMKSFTTKYDCNVFATVEMTKSDMYEKPTNPSQIAESASLQFDANLILYLWNDLNAKRDEAIFTFNTNIIDFDQKIGYFRTMVKKPLIECCVLKNKISEFKESIWFKFHPELSWYETITIEEATELITLNEQKLTVEAGADNNSSNDRQRKNYGSNKNGSYSKGRR